MVIAGVDYVRGVKSVLDKEWWERDITLKTIRELAIIIRRDCTMNCVRGKRPGGQSNGTVGTEKNAD